MGLDYQLNSVTDFHIREALTVNHGDNTVLNLITGGPCGDDLHRHRVAFVGLQLSDEVGAGVSAGASRVDQGLGILVQALNGVGVIVSLRWHPGARNGVGALRATVEAVDWFWFCRENMYRNPVLI